jgi:ferredoxin-like protein FixX
MVKNNDLELNRKKLRNDQKCEPYRSETYKKNQYFVKIDGVTYPQYLPLHFDNRIDFDCLNRNKNLKKILFWNLFYGDDSFYYSLGKRGPFIMNSCPVTNCETISDKSRLNEADLVVVSMTDSMHDIPYKRPKSQRWVFTLIESPAHTRNYADMNGKFNLTATYLSDSDFSNSYEYQSNFYWKENKTFNLNYDFTKGKTGSVAALISNCGAGTNRLAYIKEMQQYINVIVYGTCGVKCPSSENNRREYCKDYIGANYRFFLAFENSICKDYITEKFFYSLNTNVVPVVMSGGDYSRYVSLKYFSCFKL